MAKLTAKEQAELDALEQEFGASKTPAGKLTPEETAELAALDAEFGVSKQAQRELINENTAKQKEKIKQQWQDEMGVGGQIGAALMGAGRVMNPLTPLIEKAFPGSAVDASQEAAYAEELASTASTVGKVAGFAGSALAPAGLAKMGAVVPTTIAQSAARAAGTNAAISGGVTALNEAPDVIRGEESLGSAATDVAASALVGGALGAGGQALSNKLTANASDKIQNAAARAIDGITTEKRSDLMDAAVKLGLDFGEVSDDLVKLESGGKLSKSSPLATIFTLAKNKVFDKATNKVEAAANLRRLANQGNDEIARGISQIDDNYRADINMSELLDGVITPRVNKSSMGATNNELLTEVNELVTKLKMPERTKQVLFSEGRQRLNKNELKDLAKEIGNSINKYYDMDIKDADEGVKILADLRNAFASTLEEVGGPGVREGNEKVHAALLMRNSLKKSDKAFDKEGLLQAGWRRLSGALTPIGAKLALPRAALDMIKADRTISDLTALQGPTKLARSLQSITQFVSQPQVIQQMAPQEAAIVKQFLDLPADKQEAMAPLAMQAIEKTGIASFDPSESGYMSEVDGKIVNPEERIEAGKAVWARNDLSILEKAKMFHMLNKDGTVPTFLFKKGNVELEVAPDMVRTQTPINQPINLTVEEAMQRVTKNKRRY